MSTLVVLYLLVHLPLSRTRRLRLYWMELLWPYIMSQKDREGWPMFFALEDKDKEDQN